MFRVRGWVFIRISTTWYIPAGPSSVLRPVTSRVPLSARMSLNSVAERDPKPSLGLPCSDPGSLVDDSQAGLLWYNMTSLLAAGIPLPNLYCPLSPSALLSYESLNFSRMESGIDHLLN